MSAEAPQLPRELIELAAAIQDQGGRAFLVGGGVRDHLMKVPVKDWDVEVFGLPAKPLQKLLRKRGHVNTVGRSFGVFKWRPAGARGEAEIDVSIPRRDSKVGPGHRGIQVEGDPDMTLAEAAQRRDLTINALMWDINAQRLEDPAGGLSDLEARVLRAVDRHTFLEDPLRALRVVQFAARLQFSVDPALTALCQEAALGELPAERIQMEWGKLLLKGRRPSIGMALARQAQILERVFPEVAAVQTDEVLDTLAAGPRNALEAGPAWALMLSGWLHPAPAAVVPTLDRLWVHTIGGYPVRERVQQTITELQAPVATDADLRHLSTRAEVRLVLALQEAVTGTERHARSLRAQELGVFTAKPKPLIGGRDLKPLGVPPGRGMGDLLKGVYRAQLDGRVTTTEEAMELARSRYSSGGGGTSG